MLLPQAGLRTWASNPAGWRRALDVCCYQGGFALHLAQVLPHVTASTPHAPLSKLQSKIFEANRSRLTAQVEWVEADAFQILRDWSDAAERFDAIVLDPPAFAKSTRAVEGALRGYKELNLRALKMLRPGGLLVTCSCSHHVSATELESAVASLRLRMPRGASACSSAAAPPLTIRWSSTCLRPST
jgi:23S rRNA (cytosine1962-C5)-methyltransferase